MISANIPNTTRKAVYRRDGYQCALCSSTRYLQIHHAIPRSWGGSDSKHNLITLCSRCHQDAHSEWRTARERADTYQACVEYLADLYAPAWWPWKPGYDPGAGD